ncbi:hypothetical protein [Spirosoma endophyticum]|uniref:Uncharacterized protein n=1 Tax=Spirosoma endophyticum TaxID=662367 RepID=A0A1I1GKU3_9BACT|nr:hypothetical protein [Spirosoma endophyticum]SFC12397.1 hypothetical protein SAMN05216167_101505 [Spirosoma endophyticum]
MSIISKTLIVGDQLYAQGSWGIVDATIVEITETEAVSDIGFRFPRIFTNGFHFPNDGKGYSMDFNFWFLNSHKPAYK